MENPLAVKLSPSGTHLLIAERGRGVSGFELATGGYELLVDAPDAYFGVAVTTDPGTLELPPAPPPPLQDGDILFQADFENDMLGERPLLEAAGGVWRSFGAHGYQTDNFYVMQDEENLFERGTDNKFLRLDNSVGSQLNGYLAEPWEVVTLSFETILREVTIDTGDPKRFGFSFFGDVNRMAIFSLTDAGVVRGGGNGRVPLFEKVRLDIVYNNSPSERVYEDADGNEQTLDPYYVAVWVNGEKVNEASQFGANQTEGKVVYLRMPHFSSTDIYSMDLDNITIFAGASVLAPLLDEEDPPSGGFADWQAEYFPGENDPAIVGPEADPDGDGVPNLLEYLLGSDPKVASRENLPHSAVEMLTVDGETSDYLTLTFTVSDEIDDVGFAVEIAEELADWSEGGVLVESVSNGDGTTTYIYRDPVPLDAGSRRFMRLNVSE